MQPVAVGTGPPAPTEGCQAGKLGGLRACRQLPILAASRLSISCLSARQLWKSGNGTTLLALLAQLLRRGSLEGQKAGSLQDEMGKQNTWKAEAARAEGLERWRGSAFWPFSLPAALQPEPRNLMTGRPEHLEGWLDSCSLTFQPS